MEPAYTVKEIMEIQFRTIETKLDDIKDTLKAQHVYFDKSILKLEKEINDLRNDVEDLQKENARYKTVLGIGATLGATIFAFLLNRFID